MQQLQAYLLLLIVVTVQEVITTIWEPQTSLDSGQGPRTATPWGQTGSSYGSRATITPQQRHEEVTGAERAVSPLLLVLGVRTRAPYSSGPFLHGHMLFQLSSAPPGLTARGPVDRETPRLPQEATDNGADVSGGARATQGDVVGESARTDLTTQHAPTAHTRLGTEEQRAPRGDARPHAHTLTSKPVGGSSRDAHVAVDTATHTTHAPYIYPTWSATPVFSSSPPLVSLLTSGVPATPGVPGTNLTQRGRLVDGLPGSSQTPTWRGQRSTDQPHPDISQSVTSDPLHASAQPRWKGLDGFVRTNEPTLSPRPGRTDRSPLMTRYVSLVPTQSPYSSLIGLRTDGLPHSKATYTRSANTRGPNEVARTEDEQRAMASSDARTLAHTGRASTAESFPAVTPSENIPRVTRDTGGTTTSTGHPLSITALPWPQEVAPESTAVPRRACSPNVTAATGRESESTDADARAPVARPSSPRPTAMRGDSASHTVASSPDAPRTHVDPPSSASPTSVRRTAAHTHQYARWTNAALPNGTRATELPLSPTHTATTELKSTAAHQPSYAPTPIAWSPDAPQTYKPSSVAATSAHTAIYRYVSTTAQNALSLNTKSEGGLERGGGALNEQVSVSIMSSPSSTSGDDPLSTTTTPPELPLHTVHPYRDESNAFTSSSSLDWSSTTTQAPKYFIVPDQHAATRVEYIELLLQIVLEESNVAFTAGLEKDTAAWVEPYLQKAPGFSRFLEVWSRGFVVQSVIEFRTQGALAWLGMVGSSSLLERTGLTQAVQEGRGFRGSKIVNITLGGLQGSVCDWLLQCPEGYKCVSQPHSANHSCSSVCHYDHCHNHGICTHHSGQLPVCRCLVGEHFWYMGLRCDTRMTRARLVGVCLSVLVVMVTLIAIVALVAVRRYRAILIQAKVNQTRSSYRRFNHFDELSARFWLRSWTGSADSLDNPAFTRSDELLHLRALDRTCCYHDDTLSLASTCPSNGTRLNTVFPHSSQYGWRGSMISMGECGLDSGKASDLSVCSWPVEPIQWTPFPLLQQLASHRTATVGVSRPRSYCEGMELVDLGKSWTA